MSEAKFTEGPWEAVVVGTTTDRAGRDRAVAEIVGPRGAHLADSMYAEDAFLAAAAPDMLAVLRQISFLLSGTNEDPGEPSFMPAVRAAIAKATGQ
jgi:hypothetical protein